MKSFKRIRAIMLRQFYLMRGSLSRVLPLFTWVAIDMVLWGYITRFFQGQFGTEHHFVAVLLGAVLMWDFFTRVMQGVTMAFFEDVWSRNFLNVFTTPITIAEYLGGLIACSIFSSLVGLLVMWVVASLVFGLTLAVYGAMAIPFLLVMFAFGVAIGILSCALVLRWGPAAEWFIWPIPAILSPFVGVFYPLHVLPVWMQGVGRILPPSYVFENLRLISSGQGASMWALFLAGGIAVFYMMGSIVFFRYIYREAAKKGLIARYSSESVS